MMKFNIILILLISTNAFAITQDILDGRTVVEDYWVNHAKLYEGLPKGKVPDHTLIVNKMRNDLKSLGFKDESDFITQSQKADEQDAGILGVDIEKNPELVNYWLKP